MKTKKQNCYVAVGPDGDPVFNERAQTVFFPTRFACLRAIKEELEEPYCEDVAGKVYTYGDETEWSPEDYRIFKEEGRWQDQNH